MNFTVSVQAGNARLFDIIDNCGRLHDTYNSEAEAEAAAVVLNKEYDRIMDTL